MKLNITIFLFFSIFRFCYSQTGPGGVGTIDGTSSLQIWLRSDDLNADGNTNNNPANNSPVNTWSDYSGNANNFSQTGANRPTYITTGVFNAVNFNSALAAPQFMNGTILGSFTNASVYFVVNPVNTGNSHTLFDNTTQSLRVEQWRNTNRVGFTRYGIADYRTAIVSPFTINSIFSYHKSAGQNILNVRVNAATQNLNIGSAAAGIPYNRIGRNSNGSDEASGDFFEVLLYNNRLNSAQIIIVDNYLSAKYASIPIPVDLYDEDNSTAGNYDFDVAGIGRIDAANFHNDAQGTGIVRVLNPSNLNNNEFLLWGNDNGTLLFNNTSDIPGSILNRLDRTWRVSEVNRAGIPVDVGSIDMRFDLTGLTNINPLFLKLLVDTDNDGFFNDETPISGATFFR